VPLSILGQPQALIAIQGCEHLLVWCWPHSITCVSAAGSI
jgi:hypothetical protein